MAVPFARAPPRVGPMPDAQHAQRACENRAGMATRGARGSLLANYGRAAKGRRDASSVCCCTAFGPSVGPRTVLGCWQRTSYRSALARRESHAGDGLASSERLTAVHQLVLLAGKRADRRPVNALDDRSTLLRAKRVAEPLPILKLCREVAIFPCGVVKIVRPPLDAVERRLRHLTQVVSDLLDIHQEEAGDVLRGTASVV